MSNKVKVSFGRIFWPSLVASIVTLIIIGFIFSALIGSLMGGKPVYSSGNDAVLHMKLSGQIGEISDSDFDPMTLSIKSKAGLSEILYGLEKAATDDQVKGIYLEISNPQCGYGTATEIRNAINEFEASGKFVVAYHQGEVIGLKSYYIASAANESYGFPSSMFEFVGLGAELMFYKGMFDKLDLEMQVIRGSNNDFKSAVEPFFLEKMSDSSRLQVTRYLTSIWGSLKSGIGADRDIGVNTLDMYADSTLIRRVKDAVTHNLIDSVKYRDEVLQLLSEKVGAKSVEELNLTDFNRYAQKKFLANQDIVRGKKPNIAVILAEGGVVKKGDGLSSEKINKLIREARNDDNIKAIVFRVNSPGGSALASDEIWREVMLAKAEKPVIVSMGDVAASGGYYIAAPATKIFAEATTITGSIGVFGVIPYTGAMLENKLGLSFDRVETNKRSVLSTNQKLSDKELSIVQEEVDFIYDQFLDRVATGRGMTKTAVNEVARGRVWTGEDAIKIGLVDELGGIREAITYALKEVEIDPSDAKVAYYPKRKVPQWLEIIETLDTNEDTGKGIPDELIEYYQLLKNIEQRVGIQARLPYDIKF